jgi:hypothetical protein
LEVAASQPIRAFALVRRELPETSPALFGSLLHLTGLEREGIERKLRAVFEKEGILLESVTAVASTLEDVFCEVMETSEAGAG